MDRKHRCSTRLVMHVENSDHYIYLVQRDIPVDKIPIGRQRLRWKDQVIKYVKQAVPNTKWQILARKREREREMALHMFVKGR